MSDKKFNQYYTWAPTKEWKKKIVEHGFNLGYTKNKGAWENETFSRTDPFFCFDKKGCIKEDVEHVIFFPDIVYLTPEEFLKLTPDDVLVKEPIMIKKYTPVWGWDGDEWVPDFIERHEIEENGRYPFFGFQDNYSQIIIFSPDKVPHVKSNAENWSIGEYTDANNIEIYEDEQTEEKTPEQIKDPPIQWMKDYLKPGDKVRFKTKEEMKADGLKNGLRDTLSGQFKIELVESTGVQIIVSQIPLFCTFETIKEVYPQGESK